MTATDNETRLTLESLFVDAESVPSPPVSVLEIVRKSEDPDVTLSELVRLIELDVALAVQILRIANSALYSPVNEITTIERALTTLGLRSVRLLALSASLRMLIPDDPGQLDTADIRRRMVVNGSLARKFAQQLHRPSQDEAFMAGLLTGVGPIVLATMHGDLCRELQTEDGMWPDPDVEREALGFTSDEVTVSLLGQWHLPTPLSEAVEARSRPSAEGDSPLLRCLRLSFLAEKVLCGASPHTALPALLEATQEQLSMSPDETYEWLVEAEPVVQETAELLQFQFPQTAAYADLLIEATTRMQQFTLETNVAMVEGSRQLEELSKRNEQLQHQASTDALTQLPNRGLFDQMLASMLEASDRQLGADKQMSLLMLDLDNFKLVNDTYGHGVGDTVLRSLGAILSQHTRGDDVPARYGGEEFAVLLPNTTEAQLAMVAERLRKAVEECELVLQDGNPLCVTVSIGGARYGEVPGDTAEMFMRRADQRLYLSKRDGRNRVSLVG